VDFEPSERVDRFRAEAAEFARQHVTPEVRARARATGTMHSWALHRALAERRWLAAAWPEDEGGLGRDPLEMMVVLEELHRVGAPLDGWVVTMSAASAVRAHGSAELRHEVLRPIADGGALIAIGFTEPDAGSDVAAARTRAVRDGDEWIITGQKMFTTMAHEARWVFLLARTDQDVPKHKGLTMFLVPTVSPGIEIEPVLTLGGERTNATFYTDVRVADSMRVGDVNDGWNVLMTSLAFERGSAFGATSSFLGTFDSALRHATEAVVDADGSELDRSVLGRLGEAAMDLEVARLLNHRSIWLASRVTPDVEASMAKLFVTERLQHHVDRLLDLVGPRALLMEGSTGAVSDGELEQHLRHSTVTTIYGGSSEVLRNVVARRGLGLPV
jgi:alkylation response protein AidB-like acyl-CoA dehydrogenase